MSSITTWTRIEPTSRDPKMRSGLTAGVHDPLWLLARQWQLGEFHGEDAGSPALARYAADLGVIDRFLPGYDPDRPPTTFSKYGLTDFDLEYWDGAAWAPLPGAQVRGNDKAYVRVRVAPVRTDRIRLVVRKALEQFSRVIELEAFQSTPQPSDRDLVWVGDALPAGATPRGDTDGWEWIADAQAPAGGLMAHRSTAAAGLHQHFFEGATAALPVLEGERLFAYVRLDPQTPPQQIMLQWNDGTWDHRAYWGEDRIEWGVDGQPSRRRVGALPEPGVWTRLEVPAALVGLEGREVRGMAFTVFGGRATWGAAGKTRALAPGCGLFAEYFGSLDLTGPAATRVDPTVNFAWGEASPHANVPADKFSARWTGQVAPSASGTYTFHVVGDDGVRLWVDGQMLVNAWIDQGPTEHSGTIALQAGRKYDIRLEFYENGGAATARLLWSGPGQPKAVVPQSQLYPPAAYAQTPLNVALAQNGGRVFASSTHSPAYPLSGVNDGDRTGARWGAGGGWNDATAGTFPDWLQISFNGEKLIDEIGVVTLQDGAPVEPVPYRLGDQQPLDTLATPLEALVERERARAADNVRLAAESGLQFLRLLARHGVGKYGPAFTAAYRLDAPAETPRGDAQSRRFASVLTGRAPDGRRLHTVLAALAPGQLPAAPAIVAADRAAVAAAVAAWLSWCEALFDEADAGALAWTPERMEYAFALSAATPAGRTDLAAHEYPGGTLDWHAFDGRLQPAGGTGGETVTVEALPAPVSYRGMPAARYWQFEDAQVNWGEVKAGQTDLARLALLEFALVYGNDWFVIPVELPAGAVCAPKSLEVTDTFGVTSRVRHHAEVDGPDAGWSLFGLSGADARAAPLFFMAPTLIASMQGPAVEDVLFLRDEMANMAWAVERTVENLIGRPLDRYEAYRAARAAGAEPPARLDAGAMRSLAYKIASEAPDYWIPLLPAQVSPRSYRLRRGALPDAHGQPIRPHGRILEPERPLALHEEEVPRAGARVTRAFQYARWIDGSTHLWIGRRKQPGRGEGSSGLRFDIADPA